MFSPVGVFLDDEPSTLSSIKRLLHSLPLTATLFTDAREALAFLEKTKAAVIVSDFRMPRMTGVQFLEKAAALQPDTSRILLTGYADLQAAIDAINRGSVSRFLSKPWDDQELVSAILDQAAATLCERLLSSLPAFHNSLLARMDADGIMPALRTFLEGAAGVSMQEGGRPAGAAPAADAADEVHAAGGEVSLSIPLPPADGSVFRNPALRARLSVLLGFAAQSALLALADKTLTRGLQELSDTDGLTGVNNRRAFDRELHREIERATRYGSPLSLLVMDIDHFKTVNDTGGHVAGDAVLKSLGGILRGLVRSTDIAARFGGDEFCVVLPGLDAAAAAMAAQRVRAATAAVNVTLSIGVAPWEKGMDPAGLVARADAAVYRVKEDGRDGIAVHDESGIRR